MSEEAACLPSAQHVYQGLPELPELTLYRRRETVFLVLAGLFLGSLTMLNILGITRFLNFSIPLPFTDASIPMPLAIGVLPYPITFLCTDFISELYGRKRANRVVWTGFMLNIWVVLVLWIGGIVPGVMPGTESDADLAATAFFKVRELAFTAVAASMIAYLLAQLIDVHIFHFWKRLTNGKHLWLRNNGSTLISQLVDSIAVITLTHFTARSLPVNPDNPLWPQLAGFIAAGYIFKLTAALLDTIPFYLGAHSLARYLRLPPPTHPPSPPAAAAVEAGVG